MSLLRLCRHQVFDIELVYFSSRLWGGLFSLSRELVPARSAQSVAWVALTETETILR
jgi:hypothetical protein